MQSVTLKDNPEIKRIVKCAAGNYKKQKAYVSTFSGNELPQAESVCFDFQRESEYLQLLGRWQQIVLHGRESGDRTLPQSSNIDAPVL